MKHIEINLGKACNNRCRFCMSGELSYFIDFTKAKEEVIASACKGYGSLGFLGGEVTLHPQLIDLIKVAKDNGFEKIHIISNGRRYKDKNLLRQLIENGANRFSVSIHSHEEKIEDGLTQIKGGFKEKIQGLINLLYFKKQGLIKDNISINFVINRENYQNILKSLQFFNGLGFSDFRFNFMWPEGNAASYYPELIIDYAEFQPYILKIINLSQRLKVHLVFEGIPLCVFPFPGQNKKYIGELLDVNTDVINYEKDGKQSFNWQERKKNELKAKNDICQECFYNDLCEGVWLKYIEFFGWDEFKPIIE